MQAHFCVPPSVTLLIACGQHAFSALGGAKLKTPDGKPATVVHYRGYCLPLPVKVDTNGQIITGVQGAAEGLQARVVLEEPCSNETLAEGQLPEEQGTRQAQAQCLPQALEEDEPRQGTQPETASAPATQVQAHTTASPGSHLGAVLDVRDMQREAVREVQDLACRPQPQDGQVSGDAVYPLQRDAGYGERVDIDTPSSGRLPKTPREVTVFVTVHPAD